MRFNKKYFLIFISLFSVELLIAFFVRDNLIRPYLGDLLAAVLLYYIFRSFLKMNSLKTAILSLLISYLIEILQAFNFSTFLNIQNSNISKFLLGSTFDWLDLFLYTAGILLVLIIENRNKIFSKFFN